MKQFQNESIFEENNSTKAVLVSIYIKNEMSEEEVDISLGELERLLDTAGAEMFCKMVQAREKPDVRTCIGAGKVEELKEICENNEISLVVFDLELSPSQIRNIEDALGNDIRVIDRSMLILDIFALHAVSSEGKLQVELAQLKYTIPRLMGKGTELSRLGGGIGTRGPGESKLESDKRHLKRRITALETELAEMAKNRLTMRKQREKSGLFKFAIAGYTNAGKSTLLNCLTDAGILAENKLFATLDPTTRKFELTSGTEVLLTDTVGFIRNLPHHLIKAFKSTLDEVVFADAIIVVIDSSDKEFKTQLEVTEKLICELEANNKPVLYVFNKIDIKCPEFDTVYLDKKREDCIYISARTGEGTQELVARLEEISNGTSTTEIFVIPHGDGSALNYLYKNANVLSVEYENENTVVCACVDKKTKGYLGKYISDNPSA